MVLKKKIIVENSVAAKKNMPVIIRRVRFLRKSNPGSRLMPGSENDKTINNVRFDKILDGLIDPEHVRAETPSVSRVGKGFRTQNQLTSAQKKAVEQNTSPVLDLVVPPSIQSFAAKSREKLFAVSNIAMDSEVLNHDLVFARSALSGMTGSRSGYENSPEWNFRNVIIFYGGCLAGKTKGSAECKVQGAVGIL